MRKNAGKRQKSTIIHKYKKKPGAFDCIILLKVTTRCCRELIFMTTKVSTLLAKKLEPVILSQIGKISLDIQKASQTPLPSLLFNKK